MFKIRMFLRFEKEEKWLEKMAAKGWLLRGTGLCYRFQKTEPGERTIKLDFRYFKSARDFTEYRTLFADSGWQHLAGSRWSGTQYFLKSRADSTEDIFSDRLSQASRYQRAADMGLCCAMAFLVLFLTMVSNEQIDSAAFFQPKQWYFTPGLWELEGVSFWWAFLFESPFAIMRGVGWLLPLLFMVFYGVCAMKAHLIYRAAVSGQ